MSGQDHRIRTLRSRIELLKAELIGVENGALTYVEENGSVTPAELAEALSVSPQSANNYLRDLWASGLLVRWKVPVPGGGRAYRYGSAYRDDL